MFFCLCARSDVAFGTRERRRQRHVHVSGSKSGGIRREQHRNQGQGIRSQASKAVGEAVRHGSAAADEHRSAVQSRRRSHAEYHVDERRRRPCPG